MQETKLDTNDETLEANTQVDETDNTTESETTESEERTYTAAELEERLEAERKERDKRWKERLKAATGEDSGEKSSQKAQPKEEVASNENERLTRIELKAEGIRDKDIQDYLINEAKRLKKDVPDLLEDSYYSAKVQEMKRDKEQEAARPAPSSRTATNDRSNDLGYWLKQAEKGQLPPDANMRRKVIAKLSGR